MCEKGSVFPVHRQADNGHTRGGGGIIATHVQTKFVERLNR